MYHDVEFQIRNMIHKFVIVFKYFVLEMKYLSLAYARNNISKATILPGHTSSASSLLFAHH
jgi:hypothetical protein